VRFPFEFKVPGIRNQLVSSRVGHGVLGVSAHHAGAIAGNELTDKFSRMQAGAFATGVPPTLDEWPRLCVMKENKNGSAGGK
jgi:hypothetical protein